LHTDEINAVSICPDENNGVEWFPVEKITEPYFEKYDVYLYNKLITFAKAHYGKGNL